MLRRLFRVFAYRIQKEAKVRDIPRRPEYDLKQIGENLRRLRRAKHLSVEEVRRYLMLGSTQAIYKYENGQSYPQADTMFALMELYGATLYDIIGTPATVSRSYEEDLEGSSSVVYGDSFPRAA